MYWILDITLKTVAIIYVNEPKPDFSDEAVKNYITGKVVYDFKIIDGYPADMKIISSEPSGYYTKVF